MEFLLVYPDRSTIGHAPFFGSSVAEAAGSAAAGFAEAVGARLLTPEPDSLGALPDDARGALLPPGSGGASCRGAGGAGAGSDPFAAPAGERPGPGDRGRRRSRRARAGGPPDFRRESPRDGSGASGGRDGPGPGADRERRHLVGRDPRSAPADRRTVPRRGRAGGRPGHPVGRSLLPRRPGRPDRRGGAAWRNHLGGGGGGGRELLPTGEHRSRPGRPRARPFGVARQLDRGGGQGRTVRPHPPEHPTRARRVRRQLRRDQERRSRTPGGAPASVLCGRRRNRPARQPGRRDDHLQLRRARQVPDRGRGGSLRGQQRDPGRAGDRRPGARSWPPDR